MSAGVLSLALLMSLCACPAAGAPATGDQLQRIVAELGADVALPCTAKREPGVQYMALRWYKVQEPPSPSRLSGLLTQDLPNGTTRWYTGAEREVELLAGSSSIFLPGATCGDGGVYTCHLAAPVGEQNREGQVLLTLTDCLDSSREELMTNAYMVIVAMVVLMFALVIFIISYVCLRNTIRDRNKAIRKETLLDAPLRPLDKKDLMLIYTLGPKLSPTTKHVCV